MGFVFPKVITDLIESLRRLPGIGPKSAEKLAFYLLRMPQSFLTDFSSSVLELKSKVNYCATCKNVTDRKVCKICENAGRDQGVVMVVEEPMDVVAFERGKKYQGVYHVLHGRISPLENIGPDELFIKELLDRVKDVDEIIIATNPTMEGEATALYLNKKLKIENSKLKITRLGMGIPTGADLDYADDMTLSQALEGRREI